MENDEQREALIYRKRVADDRGFARCVSHAQDELKSFRTWLRWMCVDQSSPLTASVSWSLFLLLAVVVPMLSHFVLACPAYDARHRRPFDGIVQISLSAVAVLSFLCLSGFVRKYGLRRFLFFDKLCSESETVRLRYTEQLNESLKLILIFVVPCFAAECAYKIWWYSSGASHIPFLGSAVVSDIVACSLELLSWLYRTTVFFLVCVLFRLICYLQILRLQDFVRFFQEESDVESVLREHLRIRKQLRIISHRCRAFIILTVVFVTASQLAALLKTTRSHSNVNLFRAGELSATPHLTYVWLSAIAHTSVFNSASFLCMPLVRLMLFPGLATQLCSMTLVAGLFILMRSATKITHKAHAITSLAAKWNVCATIDAFDAEPVTPAGASVLPARSQSFCVGDSDADDTGDEEDDGSKFVPTYVYTTISFHKRQALVMYLEYNRAGITVYGSTLDRGWLRFMFGIQLSLVLWLLGKTVGIS